MKALGRIGKIVTTAAVSAILIGAAATAANAATPGTPAPSTPAAPSAPAAPSTPTVPSVPASNATPATPTPAPAPASQAAPASGQTKVGDSTEDWFQMVNNTPYVMHLNAANTGVMWWDGSKWESRDWWQAPPQTLNPGQTAVMSAGLLENMWVLYTFTDGQGHSYGYQGNDNPQNHVSGTSFVENAQGDFTENHDFFHIAWVPDADQTIQAVMSQVVTINAATNPGAAADAMTRLQPNNASNAFVPELNAAGKAQITYTQSAPVRSSGELINNTDDTAVLTDSTTTEWNQSTSFTESLTYEAQVNLFNAVDTTLSAQFNASQTVSSSSSIGTNDPTTLSPHQIGWLDETDNEAQLTGDYTFIGTDGVVYRLLNVTVTIPSIANPSAPDPSKFSEVPAAVDCTASICPAYTPGS